MNGKRHPLLDQHDISACLHVAGNLLHDRAKAERGTTKRRLKAIESAVLDAIGTLARQGLSVEELRVERQRMLHDSAEISMKPNGKYVAVVDARGAVQP